MVHPHVKSGGRYPVLRAVAILFMINVIPILGTGAYWIYYLFSQPGPSMSDRFQLAVLIGAGTFFAILLTVGIAEMIKLFMDIEHNTRSAAQIAADVSGKKWLDGEETAEGALLRGH